jgi:hypothetical protein
MSAAFKEYGQIQKYFILYFPNIGNFPIELTKT